MENCPKSSLFGLQRMKATRRSILSTANDTTIPSYEVQVSLLSFTELGSVLESKNTQQSNNMKEKKTEFWCICVLVFGNAPVTSLPAFCDFPVSWCMFQPNATEGSRVLLLPGHCLTVTIPWWNFKTSWEEIVETWKMSMKRAGPLLATRLNTSACGMPLCACHQCMKICWVTSQSQKTQAHCHWVSWQHLSVSSVPQVTAAETLEETLLGVPDVACCLEASESSASCDWQVCCLGWCSGWLSTPVGIVDCSPHVFCGCKKAWALNSCWSWFWKADSKACHDIFSACGWPTLVRKNLGALPHFFNLGICSDSMCKKDCFLFHIAGTHKFWVGATRLTFLWVRQCKCLEECWCPMQAKPLVNAKLFCQTHFVQN